MNLLRNDVITYTVNKAINSDFYISVQNGEVVVKAPWYSTKNQIQEMVEQKKQWIITKLKEYENLNTRKKEEIRGKSVAILGRKYELKITYKNVKMPSLNVDNRNIRITLSNKYKKVEHEDVLRMLIEKMYNKIAQQEIELIMEKVRIMLGFAPEDYVIKRMRNRLGNCLEDKKIEINPDIVRYNRQTIEYVILHQFCHLKYKIHSKGFRNMIETYMPNYKKIEEEIGNILY